MTLEVLAVILEFCMNQDSCKNCPMAQFFRTGQVYRNKKPKWLNLLTLENWTQWEEL